MIWLAFSLKPCESQEGKKGDPTNLFSCSFLLLRIRSQLLTNKCLKGHKPDFQFPEIEGEENPVELTAAWADKKVSNPQN